MQKISQEQVERISQVSTRISADEQETVSVEAEGLDGKLAETANDFDVTGFKCVKCSLAHMHDTMKHRLSDTFDVSEEEAASIIYNSVCHCGLQEVARENSIGVDKSEASKLAENAPIAPSESSKMDREIGQL